MSILRTSIPYAAAITTGSILGFVHPVDGGGCNGGGGGSTIEIHVDTPCCWNPSSANTNDILIQSVTWDDGTTHDDFILAAAVSDVQYEGPTNRLRVITGHDSTVGEPGVFHAEDEDGDGTSISETDLDLFANRILNAWNHENINAYIHRRSKKFFSCTVEFEETIWDNAIESDDVGELLVFEISGNSWIQIEALDEAGEILGAPLVVGNYKKISPYPLYTKKYNNTGDPVNGEYEIRAIGVDLSDLGVTQARIIRFRTPENPPGMGDIKASIRVIGVKTATLPTAAMVFD